MNGSEPIQRYRPPASRRAVGIIGSALLYSLIAAAFLFGWRAPRSRAGHEPSSLTLIDVAPLPVAPKPRQTIIPRPGPHLAVVLKATTAPPVHVAAPVAGEPVAQPALSLLSARPLPSSAASAAPASQAPASPPASSETAAGRKSWEGDVLARLEQFRRYPASSRTRREEGQPVIRFVIDREGHVLSCVLEHSSGFSALDREAMSLPSRAQPLPPPPPERSGTTITLVVPVEFTLK